MKQLSVIHTKARRGEARELLKWRWYTLMRRGEARELQRKNKGFEFGFWERHSVFRGEGEMRTEGIGNQRG